MGTKARTRSRSPSSARSKSHHKNPPPPPISQDDYYILNAPFRLWLRKEKDLYFDELTSIKARKYFNSFVKSWNRGKLKPKYYTQDTELTSLSKSIITRHHWSFANTHKSQLSDIRNDDIRSSESTRNASHRLSAPKPHGPTMPRAKDLPHDSERLFDEEQREREYHMRKSQRRKAREREELILDEVAPKETGREAKIAKKRAIHRLQNAEKTLDVEISDNDIYGASRDDYKKLVRERELREKRKIVKNDVRDERLADHAEKERKTVEMLRAMAEQSKAMGLGMNRKPDSF